MAGENDDVLTPEEAPPSTEREDENEPESSTGEDDDEPKSLADAIAGALDNEGDDEGEDDEPDKPDAEPEKKPEEEPSPAEPEAPVGDPEPDADDPNDDELKAMRPGARRRVVKLLSQRNAARREVADVQAKWEADKPQAESYRTIAGYMQQHRLDAAEVHELFEIGRKLKSNDPKLLGEALNSLMPLTMGLMELTGRAIPKDLRAKVEEGEISEELAQQLARERSTARLAQNQATRVTTETQQLVNTQAAANYATSIRSAVGAWETRARKTDPDWDLKAASMSDAAHALMAQYGPPRTPDDAVQMAQAAYQRVNQTFKSIQPRRQATRRVPSSGQTVNRSGLGTPPSTLEEAIRAVLRSPA